MTYFNDILKSIQAIKDKIPHTFDLSHLGSLYIHGKDAAAFLQGMLTCDIHALTAFKAQPTGCCNLQGRIVALLFVMIWQEGYLLLLPQKIVETTLKHLKKYALFSKVTFEKSTIQFTTGFLTSAPEGSYGSSLSNLFIKPNTPPPANALSAEAWHYQQMLQGFPDIGLTTQETFFPHRIGLDKIEGAISFKKGCYLGQEIIARTHFKAVQKHAVYLCETTTSIKSGENILSETEETIGEIIDIVMLNETLAHCLASIKMDSIEKVNAEIKILSLVS
jgi:folate-binding protein YgfZ